MRPAHAVVPASTPDAGLYSSSGEGRNVPAPAFLLHCEIEIDNQFPCNWYTLVLWEQANIGPKWRLRRSALDENPPGIRPGER